MIYLDNAATTKIHPDVLNDMIYYMDNQYGNAGTLYKLGRNAAKAVSNARATVARFINSKDNEIIFTSGGSEANSMVFNGVKEYLTKIGKKHIVLSKIEHDSVIKSAENLIKDGFHVTYLSVDKHGIIDTRELKNMLEEDDEVGLVSIMFVNNEIGSVNPINYIGEMCKEKDVLFHSDCVQALGNKVINVEEIGCDFISMSSHKIHGPKGVGALYVSENAMSKINPLIHGGATQEFGLRGGTENVAGIVGFGKACDIAMNKFSEANTSIRFLKELFYSTLVKKLSENNALEHFSINGEKRDITGKVFNIRFDGVDGETLVLMLDSRGICVSAGSACRSHESEPSHVLLGIGLEEDQARDSIRISFSAFNTPDEVEYAAETIVNCAITLGGYKWVN